jgi:hypothetical protein
MAFRLIETHSHEDPRSHWCRRRPRTGRRGDQHWCGRRRGSDRSPRWCRRGERCHRARGCGRRRRRLAPAARDQDRPTGEPQQSPARQGEQKGSLEDRSSAHTAAPLRIRANGSRLPHAR